MDLKSILGYANGSPFAGNPYLDIETPEGLITMQNTPIDLLGIDNLGNAKKMKAGRKNPYRFEGNIVREIPIEGNPYRQAGGFTKKQMFDFIFDDEDEAPKATVPTAPSTEELPTQQEGPEIEEDMSQYYMNFVQSGRRGNPYRDFMDRSQIQSSGKFGNQNVGDYGVKIYSELSRDLGYKPVANSIYRSKEQNDALIAKGLPAVKNSWHLSGNAIDLKPTDWHRLSNEQQAYYRNNYDVVQHNGHYHIEPK